MADYKPEQLYVVLKSASRTEPLPLDSTEIWDSLSNAQAYIQEANAYAGQTIKSKLNDGKYHTYTIQPSNNGCVLEELSSASSLKQYVMIVDKLPDSSQEQGVLYINKLENTGYIWNGSGWQIVFKDISMEFDKVKDKVKTLETKVNIPEDETLTSYIDKVVGANTDVTEQINTAKKEAVAKSKEYVQSCLTITEF